MSVTDATLRRWHKAGMTPAAMAARGLMALPALKQRLDALGLNALGLDEPQEATPEPQAPPQPEPGTPDSITPQKPWTEEDIAQLLTLHARGASCPEIGAVLGRTSGSVAGKIYRLKHQSPPPPSPPPLPPSSSPLTEDDVPPLPPSDPVYAARVQASADHAADLRRLDRLRSSGSGSYPEGAPCRWPIGDPKEPDFHFCGKPALAGKPYCAEHMDIATVPHSRAPVWSEADNRTLITLHSQGLTASAIATKMGRSVPQVKNRLVRLLACPVSRRGAA